jgi:ribonuclease VapC
MADQPAYILDSFAFLAYLTDEPAADRIEELIEDARKERCRLVLPLINLGEILYITERRGGINKAQDTLALLQQLPIEILPADEQSVLSAAHIKANHALSYADAFVAAAAQKEGAIILTGDQEFKTVEELVTIEWL